MFPTTITKQVNLPLLRQQLDALAIVYSVIFGADTLVIDFETQEHLEAGLIVIEEHDHQEMTDEQQTELADKLAASLFLESVSYATGAIQSMAEDTAATIARIQASSMDSTIKSELVSMNTRTIQLLQQLTPFIARVVALVEKHSN